MSKTICTLLVLHLANTGLKSQNLHNGQVLVPNEASINKFLDFPVNKSTGIPSIEIPLYTINDGDFSWPISVSYHGGGIKVEEMASDVGLGWSLNAGGSISRQIKGWPDEMGYYVNRGPAAYLPQVADFDASGNLTGVRNKLCTCDDTQPDVFYFNIGNYSGKFVFDTNRVARLIPEQDIKVEVLDIDFTNWKITTPDGIQYFFSSTVKDTYQEYSGDYSDPWTYAWHLTKVITTTGRTYLFTYLEDGGLQQRVLSHPSAIVGQGYFNWTPHPTFTEDKLGNKIKSIKSDLIDIEFSYSPNLREDYNNNSSEYAVSDANALTNIQVKNNVTGAVIKQFAFTTSYFIANEPSASITDVKDCEKKRLRLDEIKECDATGGCLPAYKFAYNKYNPTPNNYLPDRLSYAQDVWGYCNGAWNNINLWPPELKTPNGATTLWTEYPNSKDPNESYTNAFILDEITFPTGGVTSFYFEGNKASSTSPDLGGLRVKEIKKDPGSGGPVITTDYTYQDPVIIGDYPQFTAYISDGDNGVTSGISDYFPENSCNEGSTSLTTGKYWAFSSPTVTFGQVTSQYLYYGEVTETTTGNGSIESYFDTDDLSEESTDFNNSYYPAYSTYPLLKAGKLLKEVYKDNSGREIKENDFTYTKNEKLVDCGFPYIVFQPFCMQRTLSISETTGYAYLTQKDETTFGKNYPSDANDKLTTTTNYEYANAFGSNYPLHHYVEKRTTTNSDGTTKLIENMRYPPDYTFTSTPSDFIGSGVKNLQDNFKISPVIEAFTQKSNLDGSNLRTTSASLNTFKSTDVVPYILYRWESLPSSSFSPTVINSSSTVLNSAYRPYNYDFAYDTHNNILEQYKDRDYYNSYIWDYDYTFPVAVVKNSRNASIAYTSFEADGKGNWTFSGTPIGYEGGVTGLKSYPLSGSRISISGLTYASSYFLSYWIKSGSSVSISGGSQSNAITGKTLNGWTYHRVTFTSTSSVSISGTGYVDELRLCPTTALMDTYTYDPLVGVTSHSDANDRITFYIYDDFNRLALIKDDDGNILKKYCYNYNGEAGDCSLYGNSSTSGTYTRSCTSGTGSSVTYTVPQNKYYSLTPEGAAALAQNDLAANGQDYADAMGTCTAPMVSIQGYNSKSSTYQVRFTNNATNNWYTFYLNPNTYSPVYLGQIPAGTYTVLFYPAGTQITATFNINGYIQSNQTGATFYNISINSTSTASMY